MSNKVCAACRSRMKAPGAAKHDARTAGTGGRPTKRVALRYSYIAAQARRSTVQWHRHRRVCQAQLLRCFGPKHEVGELTVANDSFSRCSEWCFTHICSAQ